MHEKTKLATCILQDEKTKPFFSLEGYLRDFERTAPEPEEATLKNSEVTASCCCCKSLFRKQKSKKCEIQAGEYYSLSEDLETTRSLSTHTAVTQEKTGPTAVEGKLGVFFKFVYQSQNTCVTADKDRQTDRQTRTHARTRTRTYIQ